MDRDGFRRPRDTFGLAGWLFADLSLALALVFAASATPGTATGPTAGATDSPSPTRRSIPPATAPTTVAPSPEPTPSDCLLTAVLVKHEATVRAERAGRIPSDARLVAPFAAHPGQQVGLLLTFGHGATPAAGERIAEEANRILRREIPDQVTDRTILESFFNEAGPLGSVTFDIYLLADDC